MKFNKFIPFYKVEEQKDGTLLAWGRATAQKPDLEKEVCDYETTKPYYKSLAEQFFKATSAVQGMDTSLFPVREMHQMIAAGCGKEMSFDDAAQTIDVGVHVVAPDSAMKVRKGVLIGFSQGGDYVKTWPDPDNAGCTRYTAKLGEISLVDSPCLPEALIHEIAEKSFQLVSKDGSTRLVKFQTQKPNALAKLDDADIARIAKAVKDSIDAKPSTPAARNKAHLLEAIKAKGWKLSEAIDRFDAALKFSKNPVEKGMWTVTEFASVLDTLSFIQECTAWEKEAEGDSSAQPADLAELLQRAITSFIAMVAEETTELAAQAAAVAAKAAKGAQNMKFKILSVDAAKGLSAADLLKNFLELQAEAEALEKASKGVVGHLTNMHKAAADHCATMVKAAGDHMTEMHGHIAKCMKAAGNEPADGAAANADTKDGKEGEQDDATKKALAAIELAKKNAAANGDVVVKKSELDEMIRKAIEAAQPGRVRNVLVPRPGEKVNSSTPGAGEVQDSFAKANATAAGLSDTTNLEDAGI